MDSSDKEEETAAPEAKVAWADDALDRAEVARVISRVITADDGHPKVVAISAPFGAGKSYFAENLAKQFKDEGRTHFTINAWKDDLADSPILAIIEGLRTQLDALTDKKSEDFKKRLKGIAANLGPIALRMGGRAAVRWASILATGIDASALQAGAETAAQKFEEVVEGLIETNSAARHSAEEFRKELREWLAEYTEAANLEDRKAYIFIDELDRCRPDYAIRFLEDIKHLFDIEGFVFVLFVDGDQLNQTAEALFGRRESGEKYIEKFIDWTFYLPDPEPKHIALFVRPVLDKLKPFVPNNLSSDTEMEEIMGEAAEILKLTPRQTESILRDVTYTCALYGETVLDVSLLLLCACLKQRKMTPAAAIENAAGGPGQLVDAVGAMVINPVRRHGAISLVAKSLFFSEPKLRQQMKNDDDAPWNRSPNPDDVANDKMLLGAIDRRRRFESQQGRHAPLSPLHELTERYERLLRKAESLHEAR